MAAWIKGSPAELGEALSRGGRLLAAARMPVIGGLAGDVDAIRAAYALAARLGAALDPADGAALHADLAVLAASGAMTTTPAEAVGRADLVVAVGTAAVAPLLEEMARRGPWRGRAAAAARRFAGLGPQAPAPVAGDAAGLHAAVAAADLLPALAVLRALAAGRDVTGVPVQGLAAIAAALRAALYGVVLYDPAELGELGVDMLMGLVKDLNGTTRCDALAVDGDGQGRALVMVGVWTTGDGPRTGFGRGYPECDPWRFEARRLVTSGEADAGLWLAALPIAAPPWWRPVATMALVGGAKGDEAEIVVDVAIPGVTAAGVLWDQRRATLVHRQARRGGDDSLAPAGGGTERPGAAAILAAIGRAVAAERAASC